MNAWFLDIVSCQLVNFMVELIFSGNFSPPYNHLFHYHAIHVEQHISLDICGSENFCHSFCIPMIIMQLLI